MSNYVSISLISEVAYQGNCKYVKEYFKNKNFEIYQFKRKCYTVDCITFKDFYTFLKICPDRQKKCLIYLYNNIVLEKDFGLRKIKILKNDQRYISLGEISECGKYGGVSYIIKKCNKLGIPIKIFKNELYGISYINFEDFTEILLRKTNNPNKKYLELLAYKN